MPVSKRCNYCNDPIMYRPRQSMTQPKHVGSFGSPKKKTQNTTGCWAAVLADEPLSRRETAPHDLYLAVRLGTDIVMSPVVTPLYMHINGVDSSYSYQ